MEINLHDLNKTIIRNFPKLNKEAIKNAKRDIRKWISCSNNSYYMLLSNEKRDYTVFKIGKEYDKASEEILNVIESRGDIKAFDKVDDAFEIWIDDSFYALFKYDSAVIEVE